MRDPYQILGVNKTASADEIKSAYRKLAKKLHPDVNPGKKEIEQKFKEITAAYDLLSDKDKRARYDRGEVDAQGNERAYTRADTGGAYGSGNWRGGTRGGEGHGGFGGVEDIFAEFMGGQGRRGAGMGGMGGAGGVRGPDVTYSLNIPFVESCLGGKRRVTLTGGKTIDISIPAGTTEGHKLRLRGQGMPGMGGGAGDAIVEMHIEPHPWFTRKDHDIYIDVPVSLPEAVLGANVKVPTLDGHVTVKVPRGANADTVLRLKGKGVPMSATARGDMFVKLKIVLPEQQSEDLTEFAHQLAKAHPYDPRRKLGWD